MSAEIKFAGLARFRVDLDKLDISDKAAAMQKAVLEGIEPLRLEIAEQAPVDTAFLSQNIGKAVDKKFSDAEGATAEAGPTRKAFYGGFQQTGTAFHPGTDFIGKAIEASDEQVQEALVDALEDILYG